MHAEAGAFWDAQTENPVLSAESWTANPEVQHYLAASIDPAWPQYPLDFLRRVLSGQTLKRGLSIGCGSGVLERVVLSNGLCETVDAFDGGMFSLFRARRSAQEIGLAERVRYFAADFNSITFPANKYDIVFFNQSLHHVANLEGLLSAVLSTLKPGGTLFLDEYVGPSRTQWSSEMLAPLRMLQQTLPEPWRKTAVLDRPVEEADPSEAVRSGEIRDLVSAGFDVTCKRDYGGNILSVLYPKIRWDVAPAYFVKNLIDAEKAWLSSGQPSFYTMWICVPKTGARRAIAKLRYGARPVMLEARFQFTRLTRLHRLFSLLHALSRLLHRHQELSWPARIEAWFHAISQNRRLRDVTQFMAVIEQIRDAAEGKETKMIGGIYLAHGDERFLVAKEEEYPLNERIRALSIQLVVESERLLGHLRSAIVGNFSK